MRTLRESPFIPREIPISGAIYDVRSGQLQEVVRSDGALEAGKG